MSERERHVFIQWKGTDVCMDVHCPKCGFHNHIDGFFANVVRCLACGALWKMGTEVSIEAATEEPYGGALVDTTSGATARAAGHRIDLAERGVVIE